MSKRRPHKNLAALENLRRNPEAWSAGPAFVSKVKKNHVLALLPKRREVKVRNA